MDEFYFSVNLDESRTLCLAPLTDRLIEVSGQSVADTSGHFLFEKKGTDEQQEVEIFAQVLSPEAVFRLQAMFKMD